MPSLDWNQHHRANGHRAPHKEWLLLCVGDHQRLAFFCNFAHQALAWSKTELDQHFKGNAIAGDCPKLSIEWVWLENRPHLALQQQSHSFDHRIQDLLRLH